MFAFEESVRYHGPVRLHIPSVELTTPLVRMRIYVKGHRKARCGNHAGRLIKHAKHWSWKRTLTWNMKTIWLRAPYSLSCIEYIFWRRFRLQRGLSRRSKPLFWPRSTPKVPRRTYVTPNSQRHGICNWTRSGYPESQITSMNGKGRPVSPVWQFHGHVARADRTDIWILHEILTEMIENGLGSVNWAERWKLSKWLWHLVL